VITGGASGIGNALGRRYARAGVKCVISYLPNGPHDPDEAVAAMRAAGGDAIAVAADVAKAQDCEQLAAAAIDAFGRIDHVVAAAGVVLKGDLARMPDDVWTRSIDVDLSGVMYTFRACVPHLRAGSSMVAISSIAGAEYGWESRAGYAAAKAGVIGLIKTLAVELGPQGIRVNAIVPGLIRSPQTLDAENSLGADGLAAAARLIPVGRVGEPDDVASVIQFLTSDDAQYVNGTQILVDGGLRCVPPGVPQ
jgi:3-oxoacyl-[acyl-carrier protein] reductase